MRALFHLLASVAVVAASSANADTRPQDVVVLTAAEPMTLDQFATALRAATGRVVLIGLTPERAFLRDDRGHRIKLKWNGDLATLLDSVAPRFDVQWASENDAILLFDAAAARPKAPAPAPKVQLVDVPASKPAPAPVAAVAAPVASPAPIAPAVSVAPAPATIAAITAPAPAPTAPPVANAAVAPAAPVAAPVVAAAPIAAAAAPIRYAAPFAVAPVAAAPAAREAAILDLAEFTQEAREEPESAVPAVTATASRAVPGVRRGRGSAAVPPVNMVSSTSVDLDSKEAFGVELADRWKSNPDKPRQGEDGSVKYLYGATLPTLVCSPLEVCAVQLQAGEVVNDVHAGDTARWRITPANAGAGDAATTLVIVKPVDAGLTTNLFIATDRRVYSIKLVSSQKAWMPLMSFDYPDDVQRQWSSFRQRQAQQVQRAKDAELPTVANAGENVASLDFAFRISGDRPRWTPTRVYSDGLKTYIQFPNSQFGDEAPALVELGRGSATQMVNYRVVGDRYVVDHVIERAALIAGVGRDQTRVVIEHKGERR